MSSNGLAQSSPPLRVSTLDVHVKPQSRKAVEAIALSAGTISRQIRRAISPGRSHQEQFNPPLEILFDTDISISIRFRDHVVSFSLDPRTVWSEASEKDGKQVYCETKGDVEVTIGVQSLTVDQIVEYCSRFRVLIIGKSGAGNTSLVKKVFGVSDVLAANTTRGRSGTDQEHTSRDNDRFVVHSCEFEGGNFGNLGDARNFIIGRRRMRDLTDQLHAVWLCLDIPFAGGRVVDAGVEDFLRNRDQILGDTPLVVVFTNLDSLVNMLKTQTQQAGKLLDGDVLEGRKRESLENLCFGPIRTAMGNNDVPFVAVSTKGYEGSLSELVEQTTRNIADEAAYYVATMAQRVNVTLKVAATIAFVEKRYRRMPMASPNFHRHIMKARLDALHKDIVTIWNFKDPQESLYGEDFKEALLKAPKTPPVSGMTAIVALATTAAVAGTVMTTLPVAVPVAGAIALWLNLAHDHYKTTQEYVRRLIVSIVDLTCVMQILFLLIAIRGGGVSAEGIRVAMHAYEETYRPNVHAEISKFSVPPMPVPIRRRRDVFHKIKKLIDKYRIPYEDVVKLLREPQSAVVLSKART